MAYARNSGLPGSSFPTTTTAGIIPPPSTVMNPQFLPQTGIPLMYHPLQGPIPAAPPGFHVTSSILPAPVNLLSENEKTKRAAAKPIVITAPDTQSADESKTSTSNDEEALVNKIYASFTDLLRKDGPLDPTDQRILNTFIQLGLNERRLVLQRGKIHEFLLKSPCIVLKDDKLMLEEPVTDGDDSENEFVGARSDVSSVSFQSVDSAVSAASSILKPDAEPFVPLGSLKLKVELNADSPEFKPRSSVPAEELTPVPPGESQNDTENLGIENYPYPDKSFTDEDYDDSENVVPQETGELVSLNGSMDNNEAGAENLDIANEGTEVEFVADDVSIDTDTAGAIANQSEATEWVHEDDDTDQGLDAECAHEDEDDGNFAIDKEDSILICDRMSTEEDKEYEMIRDNPAEQDEEEVDFICETVSAEEEKEELEFNNEGVSEEYGEEAEVIHGVLTSEPYLPTKQSVAVQEEEDGELIDESPDNPDDNFTEAIQEEANEFLGEDSFALKEDDVLIDDFGGSSLISKADILVDCGDEICYGRESVEDKCDVSTEREYFTPTWDCDIPIKVQFADTADSCSDLCNKTFSDKEVEVDILEFKPVMTIEGTQTDEIVFKSRGVNTIKDDSKVAKIDVGTNPEVLAKIGRTCQTELTSQEIELLLQKRNSTANAEEAFGAAIAGGPGVNANLPNIAGSSSPMQNPFSSSMAMAQFNPAQFNPAQAMQQYLAWYQQFMAMQWFQSMAGGAPSTTAADNPMDMMQQMFAAMGHTATSAPPNFNFPFSAPTIPVPQPVVDPVKDFFKTEGVEGLNSSNIVKPKDASTDSDSGEGNLSNVKSSQARAERTSSQPSAEAVVGSTAPSSNSSAALPNSATPPSLVDELVSLTSSLEPDLAGKRVKTHNIAKLVSVVEPKKSSISGAVKIRKSKVKSAAPARPSGTPSVPPGFTEDMLNMPEGFNFSAPAKTSAKKEETSATSVKSASMSLGIVEDKQSNISSKVAKLITVCPDTRIADLPTMTLPKFSPAMMKNNETSKSSGELYISEESKPLAKSFTTVTNEKPINNKTGKPRLSEETKVLSKSFTAATNEKVKSEQKTAGGNFSFNGEPKRSQTNVSSASKQPDVGRPQCDWFSNPSEEDDCVSRMPKTVPKTMNPWKELDKTNNMENPLSGMPWFKRENPADSWDNDPAKSQPDVKKMEAGDAAEKKFSKLVDFMPEYMSKSSTKPLPKMDAPGSPQSFGNTENSQKPTVTKERKPTAPVYQPPALQMGTGTLPPARPVNTGALPQRQPEFSKQTAASFTSVNVTNFTPEVNVTNFDPSASMAFPQLPKQASKDEDWDIGQRKTGASMIHTFQNNQIETIVKPVQKAKTGVLPNFSDDLTKPIQKESVEGTSKLDPKAKVFAFEGFSEPKITGNPPGASSYSGFRDTSSYAAALNPEKEVPKTEPEPANTMLTLKASGAVRRMVPLTSSSAQPSTSAWPLSSSKQSSTQPLTSSKQVPAQTLAESNNEWHTVSRAKKRPIAKSEISESESENKKTSFQQLLDKVSAMFPNHHRLQLLGALNEIKEQRGGLKGMSVRQLIGHMEKVLATKPIAGQEQPPTGAASNKARDKGADDGCAICLEAHNANSVTLDCRHKFHKCCVEPWLQKHAMTCPTCRKYVYLQEDFPKLGK